MSICGKRFRIASTSFNTRSKGCVVWATTQPQRRLALDAGGELRQVRLVLDDGAVVEVADEAAHLDMARLADDNGMSPLGHETSQAAVRPRHQGAGGIVHGQPALVQFQTHAVGDAVGGEQHGRGADLVLARDADGAGGVDLGDDIGVVNEVAQDGERPLARQVQGEVDGVAHAETHAEVFRQAYLHEGVLLFSAGRRR
jgi:hypothetical protein